ncbi:TIGR03915 family putative DNA repair protein [Glaciecola sp. 2405UD65-10]|uniref:TIGR03915 family putative DNA repair protein n=1 Tax=Glaciecola sp. 2405UD65-10 TaxID=3397244 RepID=UPI003B5BAFEE
MKTITISAVPGYTEWRTAARECLAAGLAPENIVWQTGESLQDDLFGHQPAVLQTKQELLQQHKIPSSALAIFEVALCHSDTTRFSLCYRILWRLIFENRNLFKLKTDADVLRINALVKAVKRDTYKMSAYLRFREVSHEGEEYFIAWYEPEHYSLERKLGFFQDRFKNMRWSILTPYRAAHWDKSKLVLENNPDPSIYPNTDRIEKYWLTYYANIFNPARVKKNAMLSSMPKKYWKNMPETVLIEDMLKNSEARARQMIIKSNSGS